MGMQIDGVDNSSVDDVFGEDSTAVEQAVDQGSQPVEPVEPAEEPVDEGLVTETTVDTDDEGILGQEPTEEEAVLPKPEQTQDSQKKSETEPQEEPEKPKMVRLEALHEARDANKTLRKQVDELLERIPKPKPEEPDQNNVAEVLETLKELDLDENDFLENGEVHYNKMVKQVNAILEKVNNPDPKAEVPQAQPNVNLIVSEMLAKKAHSDYDAVVTNSGFEQMLVQSVQREKETGEIGNAHAVLKQIMSSPDSAEEFYRVAKLHYDNNVAPKIADDAINTLLAQGKITEEQANGMRTTVKTEQKPVPVKTQSQTPTPKPVSRGKQKTISDVTSSPSSKPATPSDEDFDGVFQEM